VAKPVSAIGGFFRGVGYLLRGLRMFATSPRQMLLGALPALIVGAVFVGLGILLAVNLQSIAVWLTPFASDWEPGLRDALRFLAGIAVLGGSIVLLVSIFVAVTLAVGDVFYERIWRGVETALGNPPVERNEGFWKSAGRAIGQSLRILARTMLVGVLLFVLGFIPVVGQILVVVLGAAFGGYSMALELTSRPFDARGYTLSERRRMLGSRRATTLGFGVAAYVLFLVPALAVVVMPAAVAGATLLSREVLDTAPLVSKPGFAG
jgi:CysZ protein